MAGRRIFSVGELLDGAQAAVAAHGKGVTLQQISSQCGAPLGSIYYRFASRDELLGELWLRAIGRWHRHLFEQIDAQHDAKASLLAVSASLPYYCRNYPDEALAMTLWRQADLATVGPANLRDRARTVNDAIYSRIGELAAQILPRASVDEVGTVIIQVPYGIVRPYVGGPVPEWLDRIVVAAVEGAIGALQSDHT